MAKSKKAEKDTPILRISTSVGGKHRLVGEIVSIDLKRGPFFRVGDIDLSRKRYWATVSDNMPDEYYNILENGLYHGYIVAGKRRILAVDKPSGVLEAWETLINKEGRSKTSMLAFKELIAAGKDRGYTFSEIARHCLKKERLGKNREDTIKLLEQVLMFVEREEYYDSEVYEDQEGKIDVKLIQSWDGVKVVTDKYDPRPPKDHVGGVSPASDILDNVLEL